MIKQLFIDEMGFCASMLIIYSLEFLLSKGSVPMLSELHIWFFLTGIVATGIGTYLRNSRKKNNSIKKLKIGPIPLDVEELSPQREQDESQNKTYSRR